MERMGVYKTSQESTPLFPPDADDSRRSRGRRNTSLRCIIFIVVLERTAYYSLLANLVLFLVNYINLSDANGALVTLVFIGVLWVMCVLGGYMADRWGKFKILCLSFVLYILAYLCMPILALLKAPKGDKIDWINMNDRDSEHETIYSAVCLTCLFLIAISESVYKANIAPFGADQLHNRSDKTTRKFFNWYYWCMNLGSLIAYSVFAFVQQNVKSGFFYGYLVPVILLIVAFFVLLRGRKSYRNSPPSEAVFKTVLSVMTEAYKKRKPTAESTISDYEHYKPVTHWLDRAMVKYSGSHLECDVEDVKALCKIIPIFLLLIPYWALYWQMQATFLVQGIHMDIPGLNDSLSSKDDMVRLPAASLNLFEIVVVLLVIPLMDKIIYPCLDRRGCHMPVVARMSLGMLLASAAMALAGFVEMERIKFQSNGCLNQTINGQVFTYPRHFTIFYQVPQYCVMGVSEVFASVAGLEFSYRQAPASMKGFVMGLFYASSGLGSLLGSGFYGIAIALNWVKEKKISELKEGLDYYFFMLSAIMFVCWFVFLWFAKHYKIGYTQKRRSMVTSRSVSVEESARIAVNRHFPNT